MTQTKHISMIDDDTAEAYIFRCTYCEAELSLPKPVPLSRLFEVSGAFIEEHESCADGIGSPPEELAMQQV